MSTPRKPRPVVAVHTVNAASSDVGQRLARPQAATCGREEVFIMRSHSASWVIPTIATGGRGLVGIVAMVVATVAISAEPLPGTKPLALEGDITAHLLDGAHKFVDREIEQSVENRPKPNDSAIEKLKSYLGVIDKRVTSSKPNIELMERSDVNQSTRVQFPNFEAIGVTWPVVTGVHALGVYMRPSKNDCQMCVIVLDDRELSLRLDQPLTGSFSGDTGKGIAKHLALRLANAGFHVVMPALIDHQPHRVRIGTRELELTRSEFLYRQAFEAGRHPIGYDLQKVLALVDWAEHRKFKEVALVGYGEGGTLALYAAAIDARIKATVAGACFESRVQTWREPLCHNIWGHASDFGDPEIAALIAGRSLLVQDIENAIYPPLINRSAVASPGAPGSLVPPLVSHGTSGWARVVKLLQNNEGHEKRFKFSELNGSANEIASVTETWLSETFHVSPASGKYDSSSELERLPKNELSDQELHAWSEFTQNIIRESEYVRRDFMKDADRKSRDPAKWHASVEQYRKYFYDEVIGRFEHDLKPFNAQTRQVYDTDKYRGYEVTLDVFDDVIAYGVLLVPKDIKPGEQRPVVVCQHGLEGRPQDTIEKDIPGERYYHQFAAKLAERGFVTFAPQNLYIFKDRFRELQRKLNPLKKTLFSIIVPQQEQICRWLKSQPFVDGSRIGFYGLSYGGKTAMRVPPLVDHYSCVICSGDFNDWIRKCTSIRDPFSYVGTGEYEIWEWNLANTFNYAEMAGLICPRPFMVERGHRDGVGIDEWVDYEYAKVRLLYVDLKIPERTEIEHFDGPHEINGVGSFKFLHKHLNWPEPKVEGARE